VRVGPGEEEMMRGSRAPRIPAGLIALALLACGNGNGRGIDVSVDLSLVDPADDESVCDSSPILLEDGTMIMYGCEFIHHCYKITLNGEEVEGDLELCGADGTCIYRLTHVCQHWYLLDTGEISVIVDGETGEIFTHGRMHTGEPDDLPEALELPLVTVAH
jgi:hypothetical protein